jgi:hypothetical protein
MAGKGWKRLDKAETWKLWEAKFRGRWEEVRPLYTTHNATPHALLPIAKLLISTPFQTGVGVE